MVTKMGILELDITRNSFLGHHCPKISGIGMVTENVAPLFLIPPFSFIEAKRVSSNTHAGPTHLPVSEILSTNLYSIFASSFDNLSSLLLALSKTSYKVRAGEALPFYLSTKYHLNIWIPTMCQALSNSTGVYMRYVGWILRNWKYKRFTGLMLKGARSMQRKAFRLQI